MKKFTWKVIITTFIVLIFLALVGFLMVLLMEELDTNVFMYIYIISVSVFVALMLGIMFYTVNKKNTDIELSKHIYFYAKPYILLINNEGNIVSSNQSFQMKIKDYKKYKTIYNFDVFTESIDILHGIYKQENFTVKLETNEGTALYIRFIPLKSKNGYYLIGIDISSDQTAMDYHRSMSLYNNVTNLPNRNYLGIRIQEIFDDKELFRKRNSLVALDISGFKNINRLFGHKIGDETLIKLGNILQKSVENYQATIFNLEVDDFMILFTNLSRYQDVVEWSYKLLDLLHHPIDVQGNLFSLEIKVGIFHIEPDKYPNLNPVSTYENSILALNKAKTSRRFDFIVYDIGIGKSFTREQVMEIDLVQAIKNRELGMHMQPQLDSITNRIIGFEALIRWNNPKYSVESPITFIELAEKNNLIVEVGRIALYESFKIAKELEDYDVRISVNISPVQLLQQGFVNEILAAYEQYRLKQNSICLEITETFLMESYDQVIDKLMHLKEHGFRIHLDNFGSGYSSMLYLKDLPIDGISISKDFIKGINSDKNARTIISKIISLANSLNLEVIAEGVEDEIQKKFLLDNGCHVIQGYLIGKVLPKEEAINLLNQYNVINSRLL